MARNVTGIELEAAVGAVHRIRYSELASSMVIIFDHLITLDQEVELIWNSTFSPGKCLFLVASFRCVHWYQWQGWTGVISFVIAELILQLRLYALYFLDKRVLVIMATCTLLATTACAAVMGSVLSSITATAHAIPGLPFCVASGVAHHFYAFWIPMLVSETVLCGLAIFRGAQNYRGGRTRIQKGKRMVEVLIRDSVFYFVVMFATYLCNAIVFVVGTESEVEIPIGFAVALSCVMGNRLCLNVRGMIRRENRDSVQSASMPPQPPRIHLAYDSARRSASELLSDDSTSMLTQIELTELRQMRAGSV
ncbi:hypothetical protein B0H21DRAFT_818878 [Amylocystis lapponica]|nr:hypothetical protein B0H21DRAFT_818878 [Amylocystis lapponica]